MGLATLKFSASINIYGYWRTITEKIVKTNKIPKISLIEKYEWNGILSIFEVFPKGLDDPFSWMSIMWIITRNVKINGRIKCKEKNRIKVLLSTENPPQIQNVIICPKYGIAEIRLVITVAPQSDIWPHGRI